MRWGALTGCLLTEVLAGCTMGKPVQYSPVASVQEFKVAVAPSVVYQRVYGRMDNCRAVHNILDPADIVGGMDADRQHGRIYFANGGLALWGAEIEPASGGSKVTTRVGTDAPSDRFHALLRGWAEARRPPPVGTYDC